MQLKQNFLKQTANELKLHHTFLSLPRSFFLDVTQRSPKRTFRRALRDIQKTAARETILFSVSWWSGTERYFSFQRKTIWYDAIFIQLQKCTWLLVQWKAGRWLRTKHICKNLLTLLYILLLWIFISYDSFPSWITRKFCCSAKIHVLIVTKLSFFVISIYFEG